MKHARTVGLETKSRGVLLIGAGVVAFGGWSGEVRGDLGKMGVFW